MAEGPRPYGESAPPPHTSRDLRPILHKQIHLCALCVSNESLLTGRVGGEIGLICELLRALDRQGKINVTAGYTMQELMVVVGSREIRDDDVVFVGMRLPLLAFQLAKETHASHSIGIFENGVLRDRPARDALYTMADPPNIEGAIWTTSMMDIMSLLQRGKVSLGFIGGAELDRFGNLNTTYVGGRDKLQVRLPGSGGGSDIASLSQRLVIMMNHERRRFVDKVSYVTSPGFGTGGDWRGRNGLLGGGPCAVITTKGILRFDPMTREAVLQSVHPGVSLEEICRDTGWDLKLAPAVEETEPPTNSELRIIRKHDPKGFWTRANI